jgi:hypothetical protein
MHGERLYKSGPGPIRDRRRGDRADHFVCLGIASEIRCRSSRRSQCCHRPLGYRFYFNKPQPTDGTPGPPPEQAGIPLALLAGDRLPIFGEIAKRHPGLKMTIDHMGALRGAKGNHAPEDQGADRTSR